MPIDPGTGQCIPFDPTAIDDMEIEDFKVRDFSHGEETREIGTNTQRRSFFCKWEERYNFCELVLGNVVQYDDSGTLKLSRLLPDPYYGRHPEFPEWLATKIEKLSGHGKATYDENDLLRYERTVVDVLYEHVPYVALDDGDTTFEGERYTIPPGIDPGQSETEYITMPGSGLHYIVEAESGNTAGPGTEPPHGFPVPFNIGVITPTQERVFRWVRVPHECWVPGAPLYDRVFSGDGDDRPLLGTVNKEELFGYPMGTLLLDRVRDRLYRSVLGVGYNWDIDFVFRYRPQGWNWLRFFGNSAQAAFNGIYLVTRNNNYTHYYSDTLPDATALYDARDHRLCWSVN